MGGVYATAGLIAGMTPDRRPFLAYFWNNPQLDVYTDRQRAVIASPKQYPIMVPLQHVIIAASGEHAKLVYSAAKRLPRCHPSGILLSALSHPHEEYDPALEDWVNLCTCERDGTPRISACVTTDIAALSIMSEGPYNPFSSQQLPGHAQLLTTAQSKPLAMRVKHARASEIAAEVTTRARQETGCCYGVAACVLQDQPEVSVIRHLPQLRGKRMA